MGRDNQAKDRQLRRNQGHRLHPQLRAVAVAALRGHSGADSSRRGDGAFEAAHPGLRERRWRYICHYSRAAGNREAARAGTGSEVQRLRSPRALHSAPRTGHAADDAARLKPLDSPGIPPDYDDDSGTRMMCSNSLRALAGATGVNGWRRRQVNARKRLSRLCTRTVANRSVPAHPRAACGALRLSVPARLLVRPQVHALPRLAEYRKAAQVPDA